MNRLMILIVVALPAIAQQTHLYTHPSCNYSFRYLDGWHVEPGGEQGFPCEVRLQPDDKSQSIWIDGGHGDFAAAMAAAYFFPDAGVVKVEGRKSQTVTAFPITAGPLRGMRANGLLLECEKEPDGGKLCEHDLAYLGNGVRWVNLQGYSHSKAFELAIKSIAIVPPKTVTYVHPTCRYSFEHLADWMVRPDPYEKCGVVLVPKDFEKRLQESDVDVDSVYIEAGEGGFAAGADAADFIKVTPEIFDAYGEKVNVGSWAAFGFGASVIEPSPIERHGLRGLRADNVDVRFYYTHGGNAGLGETSSAFLTNGKRWVMIDGPAHSLATFEIALDSVAFQ